MNQPDLTQEQRQALDHNLGFIRGSSYVLMSIDVFRNTMGIDSDEELAASLQAINEAMGDLNAGNTIPLADAKQRLDTKYGVHD